MLAAKTKELEEEEEGREAMEVEEERANNHKVTVMEVEEEKVNSTDTGEEVCDTKEEPVLNGVEGKNEEVTEKEEKVSCDQTSQPLDLAE